MTHNLAKYAVDKVLSFSSGVEALAALVSEKIKPNCILCDLSMEPISGLDFLYALRTFKNEEIWNIPVIAMSGQYNVDDIKAISEYSICGFMTKPIRPEILFTNIAVAIDESVEVFDAKHYNQIQSAHLNHQQISDLLENVTQNNYLQYCK